MTKRVRVLVVDDSAFARKVLRQVLAANSAIEVVGYARDGVEALEKIDELTPDVVTLDLIMPALDGLGVMRALASRKAMPSVVLVTFSHEESDLVVEGLELGAVAIVRKPSAQATDRLYELSNEVVDAVLGAAKARPAVSPPASLRSQIAAMGPIGSTRIVVVGTSTGGPQALSRLVTALPANFPVPILIALHIPAEYTAALARRLDDKSTLSVVEAQSGTVLAPGLAILARGGLHLRAARQGGAIVADVSEHPLSSLYRPSVDVLFTSAAEIYGAGTLAVVLTGMGDDGLLGARDIVRAGGRVITEAEASCVVYGMPRSVKEDGISIAEARIEDMAERITQHL